MATLYCCPAYSLVTSLSGTCIQESFVGFVLCWMDASAVTPNLVISDVPLVQVQGLVLHQGFGNVFNMFEKLGDC